MNRRRLLTSAAAALAGTATMPAWLRHAFAQDADDPRVVSPTAPAPWPPVGDPATEVLAAYRRARRAGKPLLVIVVPDGERQWAIGTLWGELLNHGGDATLACLALVDIVCAPMTALRALLPSLGTGEPLAVLVETDRVPARTTLLETEVPDWSNRYWDGTGTDADTIIDERIRIVGELLRDAIAPSQERVSERAAHAARRMPAAERSRLLASLAAAATFPLPLPLVVRGAALVMREAMTTSSEAQRRALEWALAASARVRFVNDPPPGAATRWGRSHACGDADPELTEADRTEQRRREALRRAELERRRRAGDMALDHSVIRLGWACGMGYVPERSARFLDFYARVDVDAPPRPRDE